MTLPTKTLSIAILSLLIIPLFSCTKKSDVVDILHIDEHFQFPPGFPPDPGPAGKKTLEGVDSDHDGLRDDVQRWIYARYPNDESKRKALRQMAIGYQEDMKADATEEGMKKSLKREKKAIACLYQIFPRGVEADVEAEYIEAKVLNTAERTKQFLAYDLKFSGKTLGGLYPDDGTACEK